MKPIEWDCYTNGNAPSRQSQLAGQHYRFIQLGSSHGAQMDRALRPLQALSCNFWSLFFSRFELKCGFNPGFDRAVSTVQPRMSGSLEARNRAIRLPRLEKSKPLRCSSLDRMV